MIIFGLLSLIHRVTGKTNEEAMLTVVHDHTVKQVLSKSIIVKGSIRISDQVSRQQVLERRQNNMEGFRKYLCKL